ncbi:MAG: polysaccharide biosynthesis tyrosine autokinase [Desulfobacterales bacterium]
MGKIFDALEKSSTEKSVPSIPSNRRKADSKEKTIREATRLTAPLSPKDLNQYDKTLISLLDPQSFEAEQFKILRTNILFPSSGKPPRVIMVSSAVPGEGKSFVASNLAISIAQNIDEHVLLIDCDLRVPSIHERFGFEEVRGLSDYLAGRESVSSLLLKTRLEKLSILPGGKPPGNPSELLTSDKMTKLIDEVRSRYSDRYVIIDSAPPQLTAESAAIARLVDGVILVINYGKTKREIIADLVEKLGKEKILGIVLNRFDLLSSTYYGYGKYSKYGKYYNKK